jgi:hypothetical protein
VAGGENIEFIDKDTVPETVTINANGTPILTRVASNLPRHSSKAHENAAVEERQYDGPRPAQRQPTLKEQAHSDEKHGWSETTQNGLKEAWKFVSFPTGLLMTIYGLNIVAWGAILFFLLLGAAPAMNHPSKDAPYSPRKIWLEIDSQILNTLFCVTGFGLARWRFRDLWWMMRVLLTKNKNAMKRLSEQNKAWFWPSAWYHEDDAEMEKAGAKRATFTGEVAPLTSLWKLSFVVWMMVLNTAFQAVLAAMMWGYNCFNRPTWATGTFIGLGCGVSALAGVMMWWEGRKVKKIEGPVVKIVDAETAEVKEQLDAPSKNDTK